MRWELYIYIYIYIWFGDSFDNDDLFAYALKWWNVFVELIKQEFYVIYMIDVVKWCAYVDDVIRDWICLLCYDRIVIVWFVWNGG